MVPFLVLQSVWGSARIQDEVSDNQSSRPKWINWGLGLIKPVMTALQTSQSSSVTHSFFPMHTPPYAEYVAAEKDTRFSGTECHKSLLSHPERRKVRGGLVRDAWNYWIRVLAPISKLDSQSIRMLAFEEVPRIQLFSHKCVLSPPAGNLGFYTPISRGVSDTSEIVFLMTFGTGGYAVAWIGADGRKKMDPQYRRFSLFSRLDAAMFVFFELAAGASHEELYVRFGDFAARRSSVVAESK